VNIQPDFHCSAVSGLGLHILQSVSGLNPTPLLSSSGMHVWKLSTRFTGGLSTVQRT